MAQRKNGARRTNSPLPSGERVARRAGEGASRFRYVRQKRNPLTLTLSPEGRGDFIAASPTDCPPHKR
ncbi:hypothetical protein Sp245p_19760 (plasmid) [Azospirillum baldaniorum]|nr:hypothetical protein Sp245p_19760 [Azospirillum baldaniorum]